MVKLSNESAVVCFVLCDVFSYSDICSLQCKFLFHNVSATLISPPVQIAQNISGSEITLIRQDDETALLCYESRNVHTISASSKSVVCRGLRIGHVDSAAVTKVTMEEEEA